MACTAKGESGAPEKPSEGAKESVRTSKGKRRLDKTPSLPPGGQPGACRNVGVPAKSACRLSSLHPQRCANCPDDVRIYRSGHFVTVDGVKHGFESGGYRIPAAREVEFREFMEKHSPVSCSGMIVRPPCNPSATSVKLEITFPEWVKFER